MFLELLRSQQQICHHPDPCFYVSFPKNGNRLLQCRECGHCVSLQNYFCDISNSSRSLNLVEAYVKWSGDYHVPCYLDTVVLRNRALTTRIKTTFATLLRGCILLRLLHVPFAQSDTYYTNEPTPAGIRFFQETIQTEMNHLVDRASRHKNEFVGKSVCVLTQQALLFLRNLVTVESKRYFNVLVPFVQFNCTETENKMAIFQDFHRSFPLELALEKRMIESDFLHRTHTQSCPAFDAVHVAALCCLCKDNFELVCDLVLDFVGKFCCGYYDTFSFLRPSIHENSVVRTIAEFFTENKPNVFLDRFLKLFQQEGQDLADHFSDKFFKTYWELKSVISQNIPVLRSSDFEWVFPRMLFRDYLNYYAFLASLAYYCSESNLGTKKIKEILMVETTAPPKVFSKCKIIYRIVKKSLSKVKAFHDCMIEAQLQKKELKILDEEMSEMIARDSVWSIKRGYYWSKDMWKYFLKGHPELEKECINAIQWLTKLAQYHEHEPDLNCNRTGQENPIEDKKETITFETMFQLKFVAPISFESIYQYYVKCETVKETTEKVTDECNE